MLKTTLPPHDTAPSTTVAVLHCPSNGGVVISTWIHASITRQLTQVPHHIHMAVLCCLSNGVVVIGTRVHALITRQLTKVPHHIHATVPCCCLHGAVVVTINVYTHRLTRYGDACLTFLQRPHADARFVSCALPHLASTRGDD